mmetsp:Transcript_64123/g.119226  ORF Transcript_64123/g.119226 Transcript_64123/m.119226 type:complete len:239 (+) Transcript_64123:1524-2240(+)
MSSSSASGRGFPGSQLGTCASLIRSHSSDSITSTAAGKTVPHISRADCPLRLFLSSGSACLSNKAFMHSSCLCSNWMLSARSIFLRSRSMTFISGVSPPASFALTSAICTISMRTTLTKSFGGHSSMACMSGVMPSASGMLISPVPYVTNASFKASAPSVAACARAEERSPSPRAPDTAPATAVERKEPVLAILTGSSSTAMTTSFLSSFPVWWAKGVAFFPAPDADVPLNVVLASFS